MEASMQTEHLYSRDENLSREDVRQLQDWLETQPHLPQLAEYQIIAFLHTCQYRTEATKTIIDKYFSMRTRHPEIFYILDEEALRSVFKCMFCTVLPRLSPEGYVIILVKLFDPNSNVFNFGECIAASSMILTLYWHQHGFVTGAVVIFDCGGFSFSHLRKINLRILRCGLEHVQEGAPVQFKGIHVVNVIPVVHTVKRLAQPFLKTEIYNMLNFHSSFETLFDKVPRECLPEDYGGGVESCQALHERNLKSCLENFDFFRWHESQKVDETKRIKASRDSAFGTIRKFFF